MTDQIWSLRENAVCKEHEILLIGDRTHREPVVCHYGCKECQYKTVEEWAKANKKYLEDVNAKYYLCPDSVDYSLDNNEYDGQSRSLYFGTKIAKNNFVLWSSDDFFYTKDWDKYLFEIINETDKDTHIYMPWLAYVLPFYEEHPMWGSRGKIVQVTPGVPYPGDNWCYYIFFKSDFIDINNLEKIFKENNILSSEVVKEKCGERINMHWFPPLFSKSLILPRMPYPNSDIVGWDIFFDNINGTHGTHKIATKKAFMFQFDPHIRPRLPEKEI